MKEASEVLLGRYRLDEVVGVGGMGRVMRAYDEVLQRVVAVKILGESLSADAAAVERFHREARIAAGLSHPGIAHIFDFGEHDGRPFIVMEHLDGEDLHSRIQREGRIEVFVAAEIAQRVAQALEHAHRAGAVHRDVKPGNIFITTTGEVKLTDFGIARAAAHATVTTTGAVIGTYHYVSPEQINGLPATAASDIYALGCVLFESLAGRPPFEGDTPAAVAMARVAGAAPRVRDVEQGIPADLDEIVARATARRPEDRYSSAGEMASALHRVTSAGPTQPILLGPRPASPARAGRGVDPTAVVSTGPATEVAPPTTPPAPSPARRRRSSARRVLAMGALTLLVAAFVALARVPGGGPQPQVVLVPTFTGMSLANAERLAADNRLQVTSAAELSERPEGEVLRQNPGPGQEAAIGSVVRLVVSAGGVKVPELVGTKLEDALERLESLGLVANITGNNDPEDDDRVSAQDPPSGTLVARETAVRLTIEARNDRPGRRGRGRG